MLEAVQTILYINRIFIKKYAYNIVSLYISLYTLLLSLYNFFYSSCGEDFFGKIFVAF